MSEEYAPDRTVDLEDFERRAGETTRGKIITDGSPSLTNSQRKFLRGMGQPLQALVMIGARGPVRSIVKAVADQLEAHEIVKVKIHESAKLNVGVVALWLRGETDANIIQILGHTVVLYKARTLKPTIKLPK